MVITYKLRFMQLKKKNRRKPKSEKDFWCFTCELIRLAGQLPACPFFLSSTCLFPRKHHYSWVAISLLVQKYHIVEPVGEEELVVHIQGRHYWNSFVIRKTWAALINDMKKKRNGVSYFPLIKSTFITGLVLLRIKKR